MNFFVPAPVLRSLAGCRGGSQGFFKLLALKPRARREAGLVIKFIFLLVYLACDYGAVAARVSHLETWLKTLAFFLLYALLAVSLLALAQLRAAWLRVPLALIFAAAAAVQIGYQKATGVPLDYEQSVDLYLSVTAYQAALDHFMDATAFGLLLGSLLCLALALPPWRHGLGMRRALILPVFSFCLLTAIIYQRAGTGAQGTPPGYALFSHVLLYSGQDHQGAGSFRNNPLPPPKPARAPQDVVLIVDESVGAHYLDLTRSDGVRSGLLQPPPALRVFNYGHAAAISGCSVYSNYLLRFGGTQQNYTTASFRWPSIWAYAQKAGFRTVYLDGQMGNGTLQNMMQPSERQQIDEFISINTYPMYARDPQLADIIARYSRNGRRDFIYVNKVGAHFPILNKYPSDRADYRPAPVRNSAQDIWQSVSNPEASSWTAEEWARYRNGYRNALAWSVGGFFDRLLSKLERQQTVILYTSDHGLDLRERATPGIDTHCRPQATGMEQGIVPLVVITPQHRPGLHWATAHAQNQDRATVFRVFPTLLLLMGYDRAAVRAHYGRPLDEAPVDRFARIRRFNGLRGQKPDLVDIDLQQMAPPPVSDYQRHARHN
jgi:lipid A ethanolaminephosphotransferase